MTANLSIVGFGVAAFAFLTLVGLLLTAWRGNREGGVLVLAAALSMLWAGLSAYQMSQEYPTSMLLVISELLRGIVWLVFLLLVLSKAQSQSAARSLIQTSATTLGALSVGVILSLGYAVIGGQPMPSVIGFDLRIMLFLVLAILGLILTEQIYRNSPLAARWSIKYLCIGLGGMFVYDFYLYADALLLRGFNEDIWGARGYINAIIVPLVAISAARNPQWSLDIYVSRNFVFHSASVFGAGVYLVAMAAGGYYIKHFGGDWGGLAQLTFLFGAFILLFALLFSGQLRAQLRVFLSKHFFNYRYDYREEWLRLIDTLSSSEQRVPLPERAIKAVEQIVGAPAGLLWWRDNDQQPYRCTATWNTRMWPETEVRSDEPAPLDDDPPAVDVPPRPPLAALAEPDDELSALLSAVETVVASTCRIR